ncbi:MAG: sulfotransferase family protein [Bacteroidota bacterium]
MKVFGIGLNKTGTTSLGKALEHLGFNRHISCDWTLTEYWRDKNWPALFEVARQNNNFEDWPWPLLYRELFFEFPEARFILTQRQSAAIWYESLCKHALRSGPTEYRRLIYGHYMPQAHEQKHLDFYHQHNKGVIDFFQTHAPEKLLVVCWENGDGWAPLCRFLEKPVPELPFPFLNRAGEPVMQKKGTSGLVKRGWDWWWGRNRK